LFETYARQAKDDQLYLNAIRIRVHGERRLGQLIKAQDTVGLNRGTLRRGTEMEPRDDRPTLARSCRASVRPWRRYPKRSSRRR
jgi:hypothetical protein